MARPADTLVIVRGGGDLATGVIWRLHRSGFPIVVTELADPLTIRRTVAVSTAVTEGSVDVEGMRADRAADAPDARRIARSGRIAVLVEPGLPALDANVVIDARMAKRNLDTSIDDAPLVVALGPGFTAGVDCHAVVETMRGHRLGRVIHDGAAEPDTGTPGVIGGRAAERVVRAPVAGSVTWDAQIGDVVDEGQAIGTVREADGTPHVLTAPFHGLVRGLIRPGRIVAARCKIADVDPRVDPMSASTISDKALAVGGGALEAVMTWLAAQ
jgi:xanthine dehydrogenase accessory factor